ncbi:hypothetical protein FLONG3_138 [Fusarium longipes]|uniref:Uncharacterized protein n=1 Tax=Fusarium longipes TaxID=694270 RepID=A0A395TAQ9_9HYPO|nr:hypothetical protein FLONG3_138 [Fusarium longipes]
MFRGCDTPPMPLVPEPNLIDIDFFTEEEVGEIHTMYLCFAYYPHVKHNSHETGAFRFEYRVKNHRGQYQRATGPQLQKCGWIPGCEPSPTFLDRLVKSLDLGTALRDFNRDLALWVAHDITAQVHKNGGYFSHHEHSDNNHGDKPSSVFANVGHEVERYHGLWKELKDDIAHALFTEHKTYFDSRDVGVFN